MKNDITDEAIEQLAAEAEAHRDAEMVTICAAALAGDETARFECARVLSEGRGLEEWSRGTGPCAWGYE